MNHRLKTPMPPKRNIINIGVLIIILIGTFLRFYKLEEAPLPANQDELSNIYDGYSIAETGADRWGNNYPFLLRGFGDADNRPPLYSWMCAISIQIFGFSITAGRAPAGIIGVLSLLFLFLVARKMGGDLFALLALLLAALSPWHILFSRMALEAATLPSFFMILSIWFWLKLKESNHTIKYLILLGFTIGFGVNAYQSTKLIFFLLAVLILIDSFRFSFSRLKYTLILALFMLFGAFPQIYMAVFEPNKFFSRATNTMMKVSFSAEYFSNVVKNLFSNLSPHYLFLSFDYNNMSIARLLKIEILFFYLGLICLFKVINPKGVLKPWHIYLLIFLAILPSSLTIDNPHALRASSGVILYPMISAAGILFIYNFFRGEKLKKGFAILIISAITLNSSRIIYKYLNNWELKNASHQNELVLLSQKINTLKNDYSKIFIENLGIQPYIYVATYCDIQPKEFQKMKKVYENRGVDKFKQLGKYYFFDKGKLIEYKKEKTGLNLIVFNSKNTEFELIDSLVTRPETFYFYRH
ncbi:MAG: glycosyltransferase family 39 protein [Bacteroidota bacterium]